MSCACSQEPRHRVTLVEVQHLCGETYNFDFVSETLATWQEGDSSKLYIPINDKTPGKKFSFATLPQEGRIRFTTKFKSRDALGPSDYKRALFNLKPGTAVEITAPKGEFNLRRENRPLVLLSNGVGIAAVRALIKAFSQDQGGIPYLVQLNVDATGKIYKDEFDNLTKACFEFQSVYTQDRKSYNAKLAEILDHVQLEYVKNPYFYVVGSEAFVRQNMHRLELAGYDLSDIILDQNGGCGCSLPKVVQLQDL